MSNIHLKTAWNHLRRSPFQALAAILVLAVTFFVITFISVLIFSSNKLVGYFETRPQVIAFMKTDATDLQVSSLRQKLEADRRIEKVNYISKEDALEIYKKATSDNPVLSELVNPSVFPASLEFRLKNLSDAEEVFKSLKDNEVIDQIGFTATLGSNDALSDTIKRLRSITYYVRFGGGAFALFLTATSLLILIVIVSMRITNSRKEIEILRLIGATPGFIRTPFVFESLIYSTTGVLLGWLVAFLIILYATPNLLTYFKDIPILPENFTGIIILLLKVLGFELVVGYVISLIGSSVALARAQKRRK